MDELNPSGEIKDSDMKYLVFSLGKINYGIEITCITEIISIPEVTPVNGYPDFIIGICNLRGKIIPLLELTTRFSQDKHAYTSTTCVIVIMLENLEFGIIVDSVSEVMYIQDRDISDVPEIGVFEGRKYITGIGKVQNQIILILDCKKLLSTDEADDLANAG
jgi:purine-binding chemotaxis protein CheW